MLKQQGAISRNAVKKRQLTIQSLEALHAWFSPILQTPVGIVYLILECSSNKNTQNFTNVFLMNSLKEGIRDLLVLLLQWI